MRTHYDLIIIGLGSMGSAAAYYASRSGLDVLALDQFSPPHKKGSHSGDSRIIRMAYFEHPDYVPLLQRAYSNWQQLEDITGEIHFHKTGLVYFGDNSNKLISGVRRSAKKYQIALEEFSDEEVANRFTQFKTPDHHSCIYEPNAGYVISSQTIQSYQSLAKTHGSTLRADSKVLSWTRSKDQIIVNTVSERFTTDKLILTAGAWTRSLLKESLSKIKLSTTRQSYFYFEPKLPTRFHASQFSCWNIQAEEYPGLYYGFPYKAKNSNSKEYGLKLAHHIPATEIDPNESLKEPSAEEINQAFSFLEKYIPDAAGKLISANSCIYTNSVDEDFIVDYLPDSDKRVILACGFSGHGFKFVPAMGELLSQMAQGQKAVELNFLGLNRF